MKVLVVEDDRLSLLLTRAVLERRGHSVAEATNVDEGLAALHSSRPEIVLLDIQIPGGGGEHLLEQIRANPALAALPVVAVTALAMPGDRERFLHAGFDGYVSKPIDVRTFAADVEAYTRKSAQRDA